MSQHPHLLPLITALTHAHQTGQTLPAAHWVHAVQSEDDAYAVQDGVAAALGWVNGSQVRHWKSGGAARSGPFSHAPLNPAGVNPRTRPQLVLGVEAEVALRLGRAISPDEARTMTPEAAGDCLDAMAIAVEWVGSRWTEGLSAPALLRMADQQSNLGLVHGPWVPYVARRLGHPGLQHPDRDAGAGQPHRQPFPERPRLAVAGVAAAPDASRCERGSGHGGHHWRLAGLPAGTGGRVNPG